MVHFIITRRLTIPIVTALIMLKETGITIGFLAVRGVINYPCLWLDDKCITCHTVVQRSIYHIHQKHMTAR